MAAVEVGVAVVLCMLERPTLDITRFVQQAIHVAERNFKHVELYIAPAPKTASYSFKRPRPTAERRNATAPPYTPHIAPQTLPGTEDTRRLRQVLTAPLLRRLCRTRTKLSNKDPFNKLRMPPLVVGLVESSSISPGRGRTYAFGEAWVDEGVALVSTFDLEPLSANFGDRLTKVLIHEIGHLLTLEHCTATDGCRMKPTRAVAELDAAPLSYCARCAEKAQAFIQT